MATGANVPPRDRFRAQKLAGLVQYEAGAWRVAEDRFREALAFDPSDYDVRLRLANVIRIRAEDGPPEERPARMTEARAILAAPM